MDRGAEVAERRQRGSGILRFSGAWGPMLTFATPSSQTRGWGGRWNWKPEVLLHIAAAAFSFTTSQNPLLPTALCPGPWHPTAPPQSVLHSGWRGQEPQQPPALPSGLYANINWGAFFSHADLGKRICLVFK